MASTTSKRDYHEMPLMVKPHSSGHDHYLITHSKVESRMKSTVQRVKETSRETIQLCGDRVH